MNGRALQRVKLTDKAKLFFTKAAGNYRTMSAPESDARPDLSASG